MFLKHPNYPDYIQKFNSEIQSFNHTKLPSSIHDYNHPFNHTNYPDYISCFSTSSPFRNSQLQSPIQSHKITQKTQNSSSSLNPEIQFIHQPRKPRNTFHSSTQKSSHNDSTNPIYPWQRNCQFQPRIIKCFKPLFFSSFRPPRSDSHLKTLKWEQLFYLEKGHVFGLEF